MFDPKETGAEADAIINQLADGSEGDSESADPTLTLVQGNKRDDGDLDGETEDTPNAEDTTQGVESVSETGTDELAQLQQQAAQANQRWKSLQGMIAKKDEELESMRQIVANLSDVVQNSQHDQGAKPAEPTNKSHVTPDDIETYGSDWQGFISRVVMDTVQPLIADNMDKLRGELGQIKGSVEGVQRTSQAAAGSVFRNDLAKLSPGYEQLNTDATFASWLDEVEPYVGLPRRELFNAAVKAQDANRVSAFFNGFPGNKQQDVQNEAPAKPAVSEGKAGLVAPGKSRANSTTAEDGKRIWTHADIGKLYDDKQSGRISKADFDKLERDMFKAQKEGRITPPR